MSAVYIEKSFLILLDIPTLADAFIRVYMTHMASPGQTINHHNNTKLLVFKHLLNPLSSYRNLKIFCGMQPLCGAKKNTFWLVCRNSTHTSQRKQHSRYQSHSFHCKKSPYRQETSILRKNSKHSACRLRI